MTYYNKRDAMSMHKEERIENPAGLDQRVISAKESDSEAKALIEEFMPFLRGRVAKYSARYDEHQREDLLSTAMMAFYEAVQSFDAERGHFFPFANRVVCARIIDQMRKINRHMGKTVSLDEDETEQQSAAINVISMRNYDAELRQKRLSEEIEMFKSEVAFWGITMEALARGSPKHKELRHTYKEIISSVINCPEIMQTIHLKRYFPIKAIAKITGLPHKKLERARTFILASLVIKTGDYELLTEYIE
jgi:RNA polymerase sigma factor